MVYIQAIETTYKGYRFRSRLEARWAVFFDALNIKWEYEPEGFDLLGEWYLPDFWLPTFNGGMYCEVKPIDGDFSKSVRFCEITGQQICYCAGPPDFRPYVCWTPYGPEKDLSIDKWMGVFNGSQAQDRMYVTPGYENEDGSIPEKYYDFLGEHYVKAVYASRSARFEHGEQK